MCVDVFFFATPTELNSALHDHLGPGVCGNAIMKMSNNSLQKDWVCCFASLWNVINKRSQLFERRRVKTKTTSAYFLEWNRVKFLSCLQGRKFWTLYNTNIYTHSHRNVVEAWSHINRVCQLRNRSLSLLLYSQFASSGRSWSARYILLFDLGRWRTLLFLIMRLDGSSLRKSFDSPVRATLSQRMRGQKGGTIEKHLQYIVYVHRKSVSLLMNSGGEKK